jgi:hypothetical protein
MTMIEHLAAKQIHPGDPLNKRDLLLFDAIITTDLPRVIKQSVASDAADLEWLAGEGCIRNVGPEESEAAFRAAAGSSSVEKAVLGIFLLQIGMLVERYRSLVGDEEDDHQWVAVLGHENHVDHYARLIASYYKDHPTVRAVPLLRNFSSLTPFRIEGNARGLLDFLTNVRADYEKAIKTLHVEPELYHIFYKLSVEILKDLSRKRPVGQPVEAPQSDVIQIVLEDFPMPDESVSWEQILDYRRDPDSQARLNWLRSWMKRISKGELTQREIHDEYHELLFAFTDHMRIHQMKMRPGGIQALLALPTTVLENVLRLEITKLPEALFWTKHRKIALLEAERAAPGRELAYVFMSQQKFGGRRNV